MKTDCSTRCRNKGFTLLELVVVMLIIGVLASLLLPAMAKARRNAKLRQAESDVSALAHAIRAYHHEYGRWPCNDQVNGLDVTNGADMVVGYLQPAHPANTMHIAFWENADTPIDPFGAPYYVAISVTNDSVTVSSTSTATKVEVRF